MSGASTGSDDSEGVLRIPQSSSIIGVSQLDFLVLYPGNSLGVSYLFAEIQYSAAPVDWANL